MMTIVTRFALALLLIGLSAGRLHAQDTLAGARKFYDSAQYDEALKVLERLSADPLSNEQRQAIDLYRTLCLLAVGRRDDADRAIEAMLARDPLYRPSEDLSPRTRVAFSEARERLLPAIVQQHYVEAKHAFDRKDFEAAAATFKRVLDTLNDPETAPMTTRPPLSDVRTLAAGFYDLTIKAMAPPTPPAPVPASSPPADVPTRIYTVDDVGVRAPIAVTQQLPRYPSAVPPGGLMATVEVVINEQGSVESAAMVVPVKSVEPARAGAVVASYDKTVLTAASQWQFQPAMVNGVAVKFRKRIQIKISPAS